MRSICEILRPALTVPLALVCMVSSAQDDPYAHYYAEAGDHAALYQGMIETSFDRNSWVGDPYLDGEGWKTGEVSFAGRLYTNVQMRLNIANNQLVVATPVRHLPVVPDATKIDYFVLNGDKYISLHGHIFQVAYDGNNAKFLCYRHKIKGGVVHVDRHAYNSFTLKEEYYVLLHDSLVRVRNLRRVLKLFPSFKSQVKSFVKQNSTHETVAHDRMAMAVSEGDRLTKSSTPNIPSLSYDTVSSNIPVTVSDEPLQINLVALDTHDHMDWQYDDEVDYATGDAGIGDFERVSEDRILEEVTVRGMQERVSSIQVGMEKFRPSLLKNIPLALGEADVVKMIQTLPGIKSVGEASSGYNVRGGASDQNLILFNNSTIFNPMHLFGVFSAFNSEMINDAELYKSGIPSQYGGRISSVLNITPKMADKRSWHGQASIGLLTSKATLEAPIVEDKLSLLLSGRTTYSDWMLNLLPEKSGYKDGKAGFYDVGGVLSWNASQNNRINAYGYVSHDRFSFSKYDKYTYSNRNFSADWRSLWNDNLTSIVSAGYDHYDYSNDDTAVETEAARLTFAIDQLFLKGVFTQAVDMHALKYGWNAIHYSIMPGKYEPLGEVSSVKLDEIEEDKAVEAALFAEDTWRGDDVTLNAGVRLSGFHSLAEGKEMTHVAPEFRLSASYSIGNHQSVKLGFNSMHQYIHKISNTLIMSPTDIWKLSDSDIKPQSGWQIAGGYFATVKRVELSLEGYVKRSDNYLTFKNAGKLLMNHNLSNDVVGTKGKAYGMEFQLRKPTGSLNGWISYAYSRTFQRDTRKEFPINGGSWFATEHDRPHEFKVVANYKFTRRYSLSCNVDYSTGRPTTIPAGQYYDQATQRWNPIYTERNGYRMPDYCRVDMSFNIEQNHHLTQKVHSSLSFGVYNLTGRRNAYSIYYQVEEEQIKGYKLSIFGAPVPFVTYNIKF